MLANILTLIVVVLVLTWSPAAAGPLHYWGVSPSDASTAVVEHDGQLHSVRPGDMIPGWGTVHAVDGHEIVVKRVLTDDEKSALSAQGKAVYDAQQIHVRNIQLLVPEIRPGSQ